MREIVGGNFAATAPLTPLNDTEPIRYVGCNLFNRLVHAGSELVRCQVGQAIIYRQTVEIDGETYTLADLIAHAVGRGVGGEVTAAMVAAAAATLPEAAEVLT